MEDNQDDGWCCEVKDAKRNVNDAKRNVNDAKRNVNDAMRLRCGVDDDVCAASYIVIRRDGLTGMYIRYVAGRVC